MPSEFSSFSIRSAKSGHGTNSNFIVWPDCAWKSFGSLTSAFAGSHAVQHSVSSSALAADPAAAQIAGKGSRPLDA